MNEGDDEERIAEQVIAGTDTIAVPPALLEEEVVEKSLVLRIRDMTVSEKIKLALRGGRDARNILLRDSNKMIRRFVLQNPRVTDEEIIGVCKNRSADDELLRIIGDSRQWTKNYQVKLSLVTNPKTPLVLALRFVGAIQERDLRSLAKSKNVSATVAAQAKRLVLQKTPGGG